MIGGAEPRSQGGEDVVWVLRDSSDQVVAAAAASRMGGLTLGVLGEQAPEQIAQPRVPALGNKVL